jgi:hypothetical protein
VSSPVDKFGFICNDARIEIIKRPDLDVVVLLDRPTNFQMSYDRRRWDLNAEECVEEFRHHVQRNFNNRYLDFKERYVDFKPKPKPDPAPINPRQAGLRVLSALRRKS